MLRLRKGKFKAFYRLNFYEKKFYVNEIYMITYASPLSFENSFKL